MKVIVFGSTGNTGLEVIKQGLAQGHKVAAVARNIAKLSCLDNRLEALRCDVFNPQAVKRALDSFKPDVVISCLGVHGTTPWNRTTLYSEATGIICAAMRATETTKRIICISSWASQKAAENAWFIEYLLKPTLFSGFIYDMALMENNLIKSEMDYTIVRPPGLLDKPATGKLAIETGKVSCTNTKWTITRADLAHILLDAAVNHLYSRQAIAVANV